MCYKTYIYCMLQRGWWTALLFKWNDRFSTFESIVSNPQTFILDPQSDLWQCMLDCFSSYNLLQGLNLLRPATGWLIMLVFCVISLVFHFKSIASILDKVYSQPLPWPWLQHPSHWWDYILWVFHMALALLFLSAVLDMWCRFLWMWKTSYIKGNCVMYSICVR